MHSTLTRLPARSWDRRACAWLSTPPAQGAVVAVYDHALHLLGGDGTPLSLVGADAGNAPMTLLVALPPGSSWPTLGVRVGDSAHFAEDTLFLGQLVVELAGAQLWAPVGEPTQPMPEQRVRQGMTYLHQASHALGRRGGLDAPIEHLEALLRGAPSPPELDFLNRFAWPRLVRLIDAWRRANERDVGAAAAELVGLGPGVTPSGDDLLTGLMVGFRRGLLALGRPVHSAEQLAAACLTPAGQTTRLSQARLGYAAVGEIDQALDELFPPLFAADRDGVWHHTAHAARLGHSSGTDALAGVLLGLSLALEQV